MKKVKLLVAALLAVVAFGAAPGRASAEIAPTTYVAMNPGTERDFGRYGCTIRFTFATRANPTTAVAKIRYVSGTCGSETRVRVKVIRGGVIDLGTRCHLNPSPATTCYESPWSASKYAGYHAQGALISICGAGNVNCAPYDIYRP